jgi:hypothetical protein
MVVSSYTWTRLRGSAARVHSPQNLVESPENEAALEKDHQRGAWETERVINHETRQAAITIYGSGFGI